MYEGTNPVVLIVGNVVDGVRLVGPFVDFEEATTWGETFGDHEWNAVELASPEDSEHLVSQFEEA